MKKIYMFLLGFSLAAFMPTAVLCASSEGASDDSPHNIPDSSVPRHLVDLSARSTDTKNKETAFTQHDFKWVFPIDLKRPNIGQEVASLIHDAGQIINARISYYKDLEEFFDNMQVESLLKLELVTQLLPWIPIPEGGFTRENIGVYPVNLNKINISVEIIASGKKFISTSKKSWLDAMDLFQNNYYISLLVMLKSKILLEHMSSDYETMIPEINNMSDTVKDEEFFRSCFDSLVNGFNKVLTSPLSYSDDMLEVYTPKIIEDEISDSIKAAKKIYEGNKLKAIITCNASKKTTCSHFIVNTLYLRGIAEKIELSLSVVEKGDSTIKKYLQSQQQDELRKICLAIVNNSINLKSTIQDQVSSFSKCIAQRVREVKRWKEKADKNPKGADIKNLKVFSDIFSMDHVLLNLLQYKQMEDFLQSITESLEIDEEANEKERQDTLEKKKDDSTMFSLEDLSSLPSMLEEDTLSMPGTSDPINDKSVQEFVSSILSQESEGALEDVFPLFNSDADAYATGEVEAQNLKTMGKKKSVSEPILEPKHQENNEDLAKQIKEIFCGNTVNYADMESIFNKLNIQPELSGNTYKLKIHDKQGNIKNSRLVYYHVPHGHNINAGHHIFWRKALKRAFKETGWI